MKFKNLFLSILGVSLLSSCGNSVDEQAIADEIADCAAIAQISRGRDGVQVMYSSSDTYNLILAPYTPSREEMKNGAKPIYTHTLLLATWMALERDESIVGTIDWTFSNDYYVDIVPPINEKIPHETVTFKNYPAYGEDVNLVLTGTVNYKSASSTVNYNIVIRNTIKDA